MRGCDGGATREMLQRVRALRLRQFSALAVSPSLSVAPRLAGDGDPATPSSLRLALAIFAKLTAPWHTRVSQHSPSVPRSDPAPGKPVGSEPQWAVPARAPSANWLPGGSRSSALDSHEGRRRIAFGREQSPGFAVRKPRSAGGAGKPAVRGNRAKVLTGRR